MKIFSKTLIVLLVLCMICALMPAAYAAEGGEAFYEGKSWDDVVGYLLDKYDVDRERIALGYRNTVTGEEQFFNGDQYMVTGSMYKVPLNMIFAEKIANGEMDWDTQISGIAYRTLMEDSIIHSNNDYAKILWLEAGQGTYRNYRRVIAPYMGVDPDNVDPKYYENNFFTPRQMITCLNILATESERFPGIIEAMQQAEPHDYFKRDEQRYDIAHKYGFLLDGTRLYMCDCAIAYTDEPIVFVMFTDGTNKAYDVMADFATLMCEYTQYNTALRLKEEAEIAKKEEQALKEQELKEKEEDTDLEQTITAIPDGGSSSAAASGGAGLGSVISAVFVVAALIAAICAVLGSRKKHRINPVWAVIGIVLAAAAMLMCIIGLGVGTIVAKPEGDPQMVAVDFLDAVTAGDYERAYSHLSGYSSLGLENQPADTAGAQMYSALKDSYDYQISGNCLVDKLEAMQQIQFRYLNLPSMTEDISHQTMVELQNIVKSRPKSKIYDADNKYFPEVVDEAYAAAVNSVLSHAQDYYESAGVQLRLTYSDGSWLIVPSEALLKVLSGGTVK